MYHFNKAQFPGAPKVFTEGQPQLMHNGDVIVAVHKNHARALLADPKTGDTQAGPAFRGDYAQAFGEAQARNRAMSRQRAVEVKQDIGGKYRRKAKYNKVPKHHRRSWLETAKGVREAVRREAVINRRAARSIAARAMPREDDIII